MALSFKNFDFNIIKLRDSHFFRVCCVLIQIFLEQNEKAVEGEFLHLPNITLVKFNHSVFIHS